MRPVRDDSGERDGWWIGERFIPDDNSDLTRRDELISVLEETASRLKESLDMWRFSALNREDENSRMRDEIASMREEVNSRYTVGEVTAWLHEYHGKYREVPMTEWVRNRRDLEKKP